MNRTISRITLILLLLALAAPVMGNSNLQIQTVAPSEKIDSKPKTNDPTIDISILPCMSFGAASKGMLVNGKPLPSHKGWINRSAERQYSTPELIAGMTSAMNQFLRKHPNSVPLPTGDVSYKNGGRMAPHKSHQSGRDIDIGLYAKRNRALNYFEVMTASNLDVAKTWDLMEALLENSSVEYILVDYSLQALFYNYLRRHGASKSYLERTFQYPKGSKARKGIIRHAPGHKNHLHVRLFAPKSVGNAQKYAHLLGPKYVAMADPANLPPPNRVAYVPRIKMERLSAANDGRLIRIPAKGPEDVIRVIYVVAKGDTMAKIARRYNTTPDKLAALNGISTKTVISVGRQLKVREEMPEPEQEHHEVVLNSEILAKYGRKNVEHHVKEGETLWSIAERYHVKAADICQWNHISFKESPAVGATLLIYQRQPVYTLTAPIHLAPLPQAPQAQGGLELLFTKWNQLWQGFSWTTIKNVARFVF